LSRGIAYARKQDYDKAIVDFDAVIKLDVKNAKAYLERSRAHAKKAIGLKPTPIAPRRSNWTRILASEGRHVPLQRPLERGIRQPALGSSPLTALPSRPDPAECIRGRLSPCRLVPGRLSEALRAGQVVKERCPHRRGPTDRLSSST